VTKRRSSSSRSTVKKAQDDARFTFDPFFAYLIFVGIGVGTYALNVRMRLIVLWMSLIALWLAYRESQEVLVVYRFGEIGRGLLIGLGVGLPLMIVAFKPLQSAVPRLFAGTTVAEAHDGRGSDHVEWHRSL